VVRERVEIRGGGQVRGCRVPLEVERLGADPVEEGGRNRLRRRLVELLEVLREDRRGRGDVGPYVDEPGVEGDVGFEVIEINVDIGLEVEAVLGRLCEVDCSDPSRTPRGRVPPRGPLGRSQGG